jgi:hypothetical protein
MKKLLFYSALYIGTGKIKQTEDISQFINVMLIKTLMQENLFYARVLRDYSKLDNFSI